MACGVTEEPVAVACAIQTLGVSTTDTPEAVKRAWKRAMLVAHPDKPTGSTDEAQRVNAAYAVLRALWETGRWPLLLHAAPAPPSDAQFDDWQSELQHRRRADRRAEGEHAPLRRANQAQPPHSPATRRLRTWRVVVHPEEACLRFVAGMVDAGFTKWTSVRALYEAYTACARENGLSKQTVRSPALFKRRLQAMGCFTFARISAERRVRLADVAEGRTAVARFASADAAFTREPPSLSAACLQTMTRDGVGGSPAA